MTMIFDLQPLVCLNVHILYMYIHDLSHAWGPQAENVDLELHIDAPGAGPGSRCPLHWKNFISATLLVSVADLSSRRQSYDPLTSQTLAECIKLYKSHSSLTTEDLYIT
jgi:hypothetical protein